MSRVVEVVCPGIKPGSGYAVTADLVLTAAHVVINRDEAVVHVDGRKLPATVVWRDYWLDAALLRVAHRQWEQIRTLWGELDGPRPVRCTATGFPRMQPDEPRQSIAGFVQPATDRYLVNIDSALPYEQDPEKPPWSGMSGAAVLTEDGRHILGILSVDPAEFQPSRLTAVPVAPLLADPAFVVLVGTTALATLPEHPFLRPLSQPPPARLTDIQMLLPKFGVTPYVERPGIDTTLHDWVDGDDPFAVTLIVGAGGTGKTRLAAQLCRRARAAGWDAGLATELGALPVDHLGERTLVVVDYAEQQDHDAVVGLITSLAERHGGGAVRLLLLARHAQGWWDWVRPAVTAGTASGEALRLDLADHGFDAPARAAYAASAATAFADRLGVSAPARVDVSSDEYDTPLLVQIAALLTVRGEAVDDATPGQLNARLLTTLLAREKRRWYSAFPVTSGEQPALVRSTRLPERAILMALLATPDHAGVPGLLRLLDEFADATNERLWAVTAWLAELFLPGPQLDRLGPDPVVDAFLADVPDLASIAGDVLTRGRLDQARLARLLNRIRLSAEHHESSRAALVDFLVSHLATLVEPAVEAGDHQLVGALNAAVVLCTAHGERLDALAQAAAGALVDVDPVHPALGALGTALTELVVEGFRGLAEPPDPAEHAPFRAAFGMALIKLVVSRALIGDVRKALPEAMEATTMLRDLAAEHPRYAASFAVALVNLGGCLSRVGEFDDAERILTEAVARLRDLAEADRTVRGNLGVALNNLGSCLAATERIAEAAPVFVEAVSHLEALADDEMGSYLVDVLLNLTRCHQRLGNRSGARNAAERAVTLARSLARTMPQRHGPDLVDVLQQIGSALPPKLGLAAAREAVQRAEEFAAVTSPHRSLLAKALTSLSEQQALAGKTHEAILALRRAMSLYRRLEEDAPGQHTRDLAAGVSMLSVLAELGGDIASARDTAVEAVGWFEAVGEPGVVAAVARSRAGHLLTRQLSEPELAIAHLTTAIRLWRDLAPDDAEDIRAGLAKDLYGLGRFLHRQGRPARALPLLVEAVDIFRQLANEVPDPYRARLAQVNHSLGACRLELGQPTRAIEAIEDALQWFSDPARTQEDRGFQADCLSNLGIAHVKYGAADQAVEPLQNAARIYRKLEAADPAQYRTAFVGSLVNLSGLLLATGNSAEALTNATAAVKIARKLPPAGTIQERQTIAGAAAGLARARNDLGMLGPAIEAMSEAVAVMGPLADAAPDSYLDDFVGCACDLSDFQWRAGLPQESLQVVLDLAQRLPLASSSPALRRDCARVFELVGDRYGVLNLQLAPRWWKAAVEVQLSIAGGHALPESGEALLRLADKLDDIGSTGAAAVTRRQARHLFPGLAVT